MKVEGAVALVTGANRGLGSAIAAELLARGAASVYAAVRDPATITDGRLTAVRCDLRDAAGIARLGHELADVTLVVNNAATVAGGDALATPLAAATAEVETNYLGVVATTQAFAPVLAANGGGAFVNILAVVAWMAYPQLATYSASKSAAWGFTNAARIALAAQHTQLLAVHVGLMDTDASAGFPGDKLAPAVVAGCTLDALEAGASEVLVDEMSRHVKATLPHDLEQLYPSLQRDFMASRPV